MKRIPFDRFSDKRFYYANAPPCKQGFSLTTDFTWRILLCNELIDRADVTILIVDEIRKDVIEAAKEKCTKLKIPPVRIH